MVEKPCLVISVGFFFLALATWWAFHFKYFEMVEVGNPREYLVWHHPIIQDWDM